MPSDAYMIGTLEFPHPLTPELEVEIAAQIDEEPEVKPEPEEPEVKPEVKPEPEEPEEPEEPLRFMGPASICPEPGHIWERTSDPGVLRKRRNPEPILGGPAYAAKLRRMQ